MVTSIHSAQCKYYSKIGGVASSGRLGGGMPSSVHIPVVKTKRNPKPYPLHNIERERDFHFRCATLAYDGPDYLVSSLYILFVLASVKSSVKLLTLRSRVALILIALTQLPPSFWNNIALFLAVLPPPRGKSSLFPT